MAANSSTNIPLFKVHMPPESELMPALRDVLYSGNIAEGEKVYEFERLFGQYLGRPDTVAVSSGTAALHLALILAGIRPGDEVISTPMTAEPTNMAIRHSGASIVWADVDPNSGNISAASIEKCISPKTAAIMVVHYGGIPASMNAIRAVAEKYGIPIIEDAAHALGAKYAGHLVGSRSQFAIFSFQAIKHLTTVDGGMLVCPTEDLSRARSLRWFGIDRHQNRTTVDIREVGFKYNMNNVTATIGSAQLNFVRSIIKRHVENGQYFDREINKINGLKVCKWESCAEPSYWYYTVLAERRDDLASHLFRCGIGCSQAHRRNDLHSVFAAYRKNLPGLESFYAQMLHLPCGWWLTDEARALMIDKLKQGW